MTAPRNLVRRRRTSGTGRIPDDLARWFAGEPPKEGGKAGAPWSALITPDYYVLPDRWKAWKADRPGAVPPRGWEWIDSEEPFKGHAAGLVEHMREMIARPKR